MRKRTLLVIVALAMLALPSACQNLEQTMQKLRSSDDNARRQAIDEMANFGVRAIPQLLAMMEKPDAEPREVMAAEMAMEKIVFQSTRPGATSERRSVEQALLARLQKPAPERLQRFLLRLITVVGTPQSVPVLEKLLGNKDLREAARMALQAIPGAEAGSVLERAFSRATEPQWKSALLLAIGARKQPGSARVVLSALKATQPEVRLTAITVAGEFPTSEIQKALQTIAQKGSQREKEAAQHSLARIAERLRRSAATAQAAGLYEWLYANGTTSSVRCAALTGMARTPRPSTPATLVKALQHANPAIAETAYALVQEVRMPELTEQLVVQFQNARGAYRLRLIDLLGYQTGSATVVLPSLLKAFSEDDPATRIAALNAIARLSHPETAAAVMAGLNNGNEGVREAAIRAVPSVAYSLQKAGKTDVAVVLARTALQKTRNRENVLQLVGLLRGLGVHMHPRDIALQEGMIVNWWVLGPLAARDAMRQHEMINVEAAVDLNAEVNGTRWRRIELDDPQGVLDFGQVARRRDNTGAYACAEVFSEAPQQVLLRIGSDDDVTCWVNGRKVHEFIGDRGLSIDEDTASVTLEQGWNRILCKVLNGGGYWQLAVRIVAPDGTPLRLQQR